MIYVTQLFIMFSGLYHLSYLIIVIGCTWKLAQVATYISSDNVGT
jgi:hypothetical protein